MLQPVQLTSLLLALFTLIGCATHNDKMAKAKELVVQGEYDKAANTVEKELSQSRNLLLKEIELGSIYQLKGDYQTSLQHLEVADQLADELYTRRFSDLLLRTTTNATYTTYRSNIIERIYIHYYKMLNYFYLAEEATNDLSTQNLMDSARVEARRALILLDENVHQQGDYQTAEEDKQSLLYQLRRLFALLNGDIINPTDLVFRDSAFSHYMIGSLYEKMGELDNARISYQRSATLYEQGYAKQYDLDPTTAEMAWFAAARTLTKLQDPSSKELAAKKLSLDKQQELTPLPAEGELLIIQEIDLVAPRGELNIWVHIEGNRIKIRPIPTGTLYQQAYQLAWFYYLYADKGLISIIERIRAEDYIGLINRNHERVRQLPSPLADFLNQIGMLEIMQTTGIRLSVPLLYYQDLAIKSSQVQINNQKPQKLTLADNISGLFMAHHLLNAQSEITNAMAIETLRLGSCIQTGLPPLACNLLAAGSTSADTRSWLTLPYEIRLLRTQLPAGTHQIKITSQTSKGYQLEENAEVEIKAGELKMVRIRTFDPIPPKNK